MKIESTQGTRWETKITEPRPNEEFRMGIRNWKMEKDTDVHL